MTASSTPSTRRASSDMTPDKDSDLEKDVDASAEHASPHASDEKAALGPPPLDWDGPEDPDNPYNWPLWKRAFNSVLTGLLAFAVTFGSSIYTPGASDVASYFHVGRTASFLPLTVYTLAIGVGPVIAAPISETRGRRVVYWISVPLSMLFTLGAGFSQTFAQLLVCRFFAGMFGSPVLAVGSGTNADLWPIQSRAVAVSSFLMAPFLGPALGPFIGGYAVLGTGDWRWTQWVLLFFTFAFFLLSLCMSETYKKIILAKRAKRRGHVVPHNPNAPSKAAMLRTLFTITLFRSIHMLFTEPIVMFFSIYVAFSFSVLFAFFAAYPFTFEGVYHFNVAQTGLTFLAIGLGVILACVLGTAVDRLVYQPKWRAAQAEGKTHIAPEHRLYAAMIGSFGLPIGLFWFAWTARSDIHWISPVLAGIPFAIGNLTIFMSTVLYLVDVYGPLTGASAVAANGLLRYTAGAVFPLFTVQMYGSLGIAWATTVWGVVSILLLPIPWVMFKFGKQIRARSQYETLKDC